MGRWKAYPGDLVKPAHPIGLWRAIPRSEDTVDNLIEELTSNDMLFVIATHIDGVSNNRTHFVMTTGSRLGWVVDAVELLSRA